MSEFITSPSPNRIEIHPTPLPDNPQAVATGLTSALRRKGYRLRGGVAPIPGGLAVTVEDNDLLAAISTCEDLLGSEDKARGFYAAC